MRAAALHHFIGRDVEHDADGAPRIPDHHISLSHDGDYVAVVVGEEPVGIDVCLRAHAERARNILRWLGITVPIDPCAQFAALEAALKLRRLGIERLLDRDVTLHADGDTVVVRGLGDDIRVDVRIEHDHVVAVCG